MGLGPRPAVEGIARLLGVEARGPGSGGSVFGQPDRHPAALGNVGRLAHPQDPIRQHRRCGLERDHPGPGIEAERGSASVQPTLARPVAPCS